LRRALTVAVALMMALAGCRGHWQIILHTRIAPDGKVERRVSVAGHEEHDVAKAFEVPAAGPWSTREAGDDRYVVSGTFESPAKMLSGYARRVEDVGETAPSRIEWQREDRIFYTLYKYRETITDVVTLDRFDSAADQVIDLGVEGACHVLDDCLGDTYDVSRLTAYLRRNVRPALKSVAWALCASAGREVDTDRIASGESVLVSSPEAIRTVKALVSRHRIEPEVVELLSDYSDTRAKQVLTRIVTRRVRLKSARDRRLNDQERKQFGDLLFSDAMQKAVGVSAQGFLKKRLGDEKAQGAFIRKMWVSLFGAYQEFLFGPDFRFRASLVLPGQVMRTNGYLFGPSEVAWRFAHSEVCPFGYVMHATSVVYHDVAQRAVSDKSFVTSPRQVLAFESMLKAQIGEWAIIQETLRECTKAGSPAPLEKLIEEKGAKSAVAKQAARIKQFIASGGKEED